MRSESFFRPHWEPAGSIYDALVAAMERRKEHGYPAWIDAERGAVHEAAVTIARAQGLREVTMDEVLSAERLACGHVDYAKKFACGVATKMKPDARVGGARCG